MSAPALNVVVVLHRHSHDLTTHYLEPFSLLGLGVHVGPHFVCALVLDLEIPLGHLISDKEKPILDVLAILPSAHPSILCQQYGGLVILVEDIIFNCILLPP